MFCRSCGNALPANATGCPRCNPVARIDKTRRLSLADLHKTRALVTLDRCRNCGFMVFPADTECAACGTGINRIWQQKPAATKTKARRTAAPGRLKAVGIAVSFVALLSLTALLWRIIAHS